MLLTLSTQFSWPFLANNPDRINASYHRIYFLDKLSLLVWKEMWSVEKNPLINPICMIVIKNFLPLEISSSKLSITDVVNESASIVSNIMLSTVDTFISNMLAVCTVLLSMIDATVFSSSLFPNYYCFPDVWTPPQTHRLYNWRLPRNTFF